MHLENDEVIVTTSVDFNDGVKSKTLTFQMNYVISGIKTESEKEVIDFLKTMVKMSIRDLKSKKK